MAASGADILAAFAEKYPQCIYWLLAGKADPKAAHTKPK